MPSREIGLPLTAPVLRLLGCDEACEYRPLPVARAEIRDDRQYPFHPWRFPHAVFGEDVLHIDAQMRRVANAFHGRPLTLLEGLIRQARTGFNGASRRHWRSFCGGRMAVMPELSGSTAVGGALV